jgi:hypothetical protein
MPCIALFVVHLYVSSPSSLSIDPDVDVAPETVVAPEVDYATDDQTLAVELPGKHPILSIPLSPTLLSLMLALEVAAATAVLYLLHSLFNCNLLLILTCYPKLLRIGWVETIRDPHLSRLPRWIIRRPEQRD